ncbi:helix-turn-helix domain-containing protein [Micromonospora sp. WMMD1102]|uniref:helix-turn-helix domain-containing protein n=1 Tax=Micromonospora sp. WMMD1102 TaxID=3016105 RepID=UPI0024156B73|nr:helix-turn-helix domain-containing protein [Micromonospora sp. WMMD1102]MDG4788094.1 helix-turn-helix domain-containing protein [Micromonospora sp. WMMD1102]
MQRNPLSGPVELADGSVIVPAHLAKPVRRFLVEVLREHIRSDGGAPSAAARELLFVLARAEHHHDQAAEFATETPTPAGPKVEISTTEAAAVLGCSVQFVRRLCRSGGVSARRAGRRTWLVDVASLDHYRYGGTR